jgi:tetrapyrrole methylase family protein/MazG family protein
VVVGLGPGGTGLLVPAARAALEQCPHRFVRTTRHPAVDDLARDGLEFDSFDDRYEAAGDLDEVYRGIVDTLVAAARERGEIVYAVPGNPAVAERTVELLHDAARAGRVRLDVVPGMSFADLAWVRLGIDPMATGARVVDARALGVGTVDDGGPMLVAQCDHPLVLADVKLTLLERLDPGTPVRVLHHLGLPDERVEDVALAALDRVQPDHLTAVLVPMAPDSATRELGRLLSLAERLRGPGGCPWDAEQTHHSLTRYLLEEAYEVVEAVERLPVDAPGGTAPDDPAYEGLVDELGDLLYQVIFHAVLAGEAGAFGMADVARGIHDKLVRRHPHVFGDLDAQTSSDVMAHWEQIKKQEKGVDSIVADITPGLPSLLHAHKLMRKAASVGLDAGDEATSSARVGAALALWRDGSRGPEVAVGDLLAAAVALARASGVDAESALRGWAARFTARFQAMERLAGERGLDLHHCDAEQVRALWEETVPQE